MPRSVLSVNLSTLNSVWLTERSASSNPALEQNRGAQEEKMASQGVFCPCFVIQEDDHSPLPESAPHSLPQPWQTGPASLLHSPGPLLHPDMHHVWSRATAL